MGTQSPEVMQFVVLPPYQGVGHWADRHTKPPPAHGMSETATVGSIRALMMDLPVSRCEPFLNEVGGARHDLFRTLLCSARLLAHIPALGVHFV